MADTVRILEDFARREPPVRAFVDRAFEVARDGESVAFRAMYASVARRLGAAGGAPPENPPSVSDAARPHLTLTDWVRLALLARALDAAGERAPAVAQALFESGELGEQESLLRTLALLPDPARFVEIALLGCRTNARRVFEAVACDNVYPERHFSELSFNQMVLKAIFIEAPASRIEGLHRRSGDELKRMARDYASERRAAGRPVPSDIALILGETSA